MIEHKTVSLANQVFEHLENDILSGKYQRGEILTEMKLCAELGVSRTPVREALHRLAQEHIIEETAKGAMVLGISRKDLEDIYTVRINLEGIAAEATAKVITDEQLKQLRDALELQEFYLKKNDPERIRIMDSQFHQLLYKFSGSVTFYDVLVPLHKKTQKYRKASVEHSDRAEVSVKEHWDVYNAIAAHDGEAARKMMNIHTRNAFDSIIKYDKTAANNRS